MKSLKYIILILIAASSIACEETVTLDVNQTKSKIVVDGLLTDSLQRHYVKLKQSINFYNQNGLPAVQDAQVSVIEKSPSGEENEFLYLLDDSEPGLYLSEVAYAGKVDFEYTLNINWQGQNYRSTDILKPVGPIVKMEPEEISAEDVGDDTKDSLSTEIGPFYILKLYAKEPPNTVDYYHWRFYRNGKFKNNNGQDIYYASDDLVQENIDGIEMPGIYVTGDTVYTEQFGITRNGYLFLVDMETVIYTDGGMFSPPPANPRNNLSNGALGFFMVASVKHISTIIP